ncbi:MAG: ABC transporter permease [Lachnospiraceae bacterium]|nr:ABC transporter permease [Lachnospiraceae bacterium]
MISSCMNSNVAQRTKFFGMMRCIGASKQQIVRFVRLEALNWCKTAIPIGCVLGMVTCWVSCLILKFIVKGEWVDMPLFSVSISGIFCGAAIGIITVFIAAQSPAKQAAKVSPIAAISGNTETNKKIVHAANTRLFKVETSLGIHHATGTKKNLILMTGSFALTIMLFLTFSACLDIVHKLLPSASDFTPDITISSQDESNSIDKSISEKISDISGVKSVFGMMYSLEYPTEINGNVSTVDLYSYGDTMMDSFKKSVISGNISKVYGNSQYVMAIYSDHTGLDVGDKIKIGREELEVACVMSEGVGSVSGSAVVVCSEETYIRLMGGQGYAMLSVVLEKDVSDTAINKIYNLSIKQYGAMRAVGMGSKQVTKMITAEAATYAICGTAVGIILGLLLHYLIYTKIVITHFGGAWNIPFSTIVIVLLLVVFSCIISVYAPAKRIRNMQITATINEL